MHGIGSSTSRRADAAAAPGSDAVGGEDLQAAGWERRFDVDSARVEEIEELYRSAGYEVHVRALAPESFGPECAGCALGACSRYVELYTRRTGDPSTSTPSPMKPMKPMKSTAPASLARTKEHHRWQPTS